MLKIVALCLCWAVLIVSGTATNSTYVTQNETNVSTPIEPTQPSNITTPKPEPTITTTLAPIPETTTILPDTTTKAPETTTTPTPDTTTTTTTTTTLKPTTSTSKPPTTTVAPVTTPAPPAPTPKTGQWSVNGTNQTCIVIRMAVQMTISYMTKDDKIKYKELTLPTENQSSIATGNCGASEQTINITWHGGDDSLEIHFVKNDTTKRYYIHHLGVNLGEHEFPDAKPNETFVFINETNQLSTGLSNSYRCVRLQNFNLTSEEKNATGSWISVKDLQFQAFKSDTTNNFGLAQDCSSDVPDVVPIAVGCALTALVIIVLVAYLVGRRRSQARGYLSM